MSERAWEAVTVRRSADREMETRGTSLKVREKLNKDLH